MRLPCPYDNLGPSVRPSTDGSVLAIAAQFGSDGDLRAIREAANLLDAASAASPLAQRRGLACGRWARRLLEGVSAGRHCSETLRQLMRQHHLGRAGDLDAVVRDLEALPLS